MQARTVTEIQEEINRLKSELSQARRERVPEPVSDYELRRTDGSTVRLSELFGDKSDLLVVHNMGKGCRYCTLWADGLNGFTDHIENRSAFVLVSGDDPETAGAFSAGRNWRFTVLSGKDSEFTKAMGYITDDGNMPGVSAFRKLDDGSIVRTGNDFFGPGDDYCAPWPMFDLLQGGAGDWEPKYRYNG